LYYNSGQEFHPGKMLLMLTQLTINNYAIVDSLDIELQPGMTVITGETGAGKSIMLDALALTLGDRAEKDVIRADGERADISACFEILDNPQAQEWLQANDFSAGDNQECILRRVITREGRSKAYINGQATTLNELMELGEMLVDIHSQHEHQSLLKTAVHQRLLDEYSGAQTLASEVRQLAAQWQQVRQKLDILRNQAEEHNAQFQLLSYQFKELDDLNLTLAELETIEEEHAQLSHAETFLSTTQTALDICQTNEEHNLQSALNHALSLLQEVPFESKSVKSAEALLETALIQIEEASTELARALDRFELNPQRLQELDERLAEIHQLARKHRVTPTDIPDIHARLQQQLSEMSSADEQMDNMEAELNILLKQYRQQAEILSDRRKKGAEALALAVNAQLQKLDMKAASFSIALNSNPENEAPAAKGYESIEFLISTNPGQAPKPLIRIASGGELSRISLAIQVVTAQTSAIPSLIFDEVDVGIGGGVARSVGELLRQLGEKGQVICVTHQPQVASQGHHHYFISKNTTKDSTSTRIKILDQQEKVQEIARMLAGDKPSESSLAHAEQMLA